MGYYPSAVKQRGIIIGIFLMLFLVTGCATRNEGNITRDDSRPEKERAVDTSGSESRRQITGISLIPGPAQLEIWIQGSEKLEYTSIKQPFPFAVSVYLPDTELMAGMMPDQVQDPRISGIKAGYADKEQTTVKMEILLTRDLSYQVREDGDRLGIILEGKTAPVGEVPVMEGITPVVSVDTGKSAVPDVTVTSPPGPPVIPGKKSELTRIEFDTRPTGHSDILVQTSHPVRYETRQVNQDFLTLILYNTKIPEHHQRPLLTRYFNSAVEQVIPKNEPAGDSRIDIHIREQVPFRVVQNTAGIQMAFEPSSVEPPVFDEARAALVSGMDKTVAAERRPAEINSGAKTTSHPDAVSRRQVNHMGTAETDIAALGKPPQYTGEKIKLDFFDTDIKNVFRILRGVSGMNFAVDSDVQGKVTLSLEEPVPWDQVLDLILKMNGLGKKMEGRVIRIATAETLRSEEQMVQDMIEARKKAVEQKVSLEPLVTEYIPINYSDATTDIQPHVAQILTPERGTLSVDTRTNMIIITDTQAKIDQVYELIYRLDTVTPQIMIEARVVEVTKEFSRSIGLNWNLSNASTVTSGFVDEFNVAVNSSSVGISGGFSFFNLFGSTSAALNAQLEASEQLGEVRIVSSPRILTLDNKKAMIKQGQEYAYLERDDSGGSSVAFKDIDLLLEVTPHVTPDKRISMTVRLTKNDVASVTSDGVPTLATNEAETELLVNNNDTVVIGGVVKTTQSEDEDGIPFLTGIPLLGYLFSTKAEVDNRNELLIFLTPSIVQLEQKRNTAVR